MVVTYIYYDGTLEDLTKNIESIKNIYNGSMIRNPYSNDVDEIESIIYPNFEKYKVYKTIYVGNLAVFNTSLKKGRTFFLWSDNNVKPEDKPLYSWDYSVILLYILLTLVVMLIIISIFCYFNDIDIIYYLGVNFPLSLY